MRVPARAIAAMILLSAAAHADGYQTNRNSHLGRPAGNFSSHPTGGCLGSMAMR